MNETPEHVESLRVENIKHDLEAWLAAKVWSPSDLRDWLKGYKFFTYGDEPYLWLFKCLPKSSKYLPEMSRRIAEFLNEQAPYKTSNSNEEDDEKFFYNLFNLSAGLGYRNGLGTALEHVFNYFNEHADEREKFFSQGKWYNLNNAFREALINNQTDNTLKKVWRDGLKRKQSSFLLGNMYSSFRGLLYMPGGENSKKPDFHEIGWALKRMADYLKNQKTGHLKFRRLLERIKEVWPHYSKWDETLLQLAIQHDWPDWAIVQLDKLVLPIEKKYSRQKHYIVWEAYQPFLEELKVYPTNTNKAGILLEIPPSSEAIDFLTKTVPTVEGRRLRSPDSHYRSILGVANQGFIELQSSLDSPGNRKLAGIIERGRPGLLQKLGLQ